MTGSDKMSEKYSLQPRESGQKNCAHSAIKERCPLRQGQWRLWGSDEVTRPQDDLSGDCAKHRSMAVVHNARRDRIWLAMRVVSPQYPVHIYSYMCGHRTVQLFLRKELDNHLEKAFRI